jgi:hypothetical protein
MLDVLRKITKPLFSDEKRIRERILRSCFPHPEELGLNFDETGDSQTAGSTDPSDPELQIVNACMREVHGCAFSTAQRSRMLNYGEEPDNALFHLKTQALYSKLYEANVGNLSFFSNPLTPDYATYPQCWLQWDHSQREYFLDPIHYDHAIPLKAAA